MITRRPRRLVGVSYVGFQRYFLTICTAFRRRVFADAAAVSPVLGHLRQTSALFEFALTAYCFMPDHLHVLATGESEQADFLKFVRRFKQMAGYAHRRAKSGEFWQT